MLRECNYQPRILCPSKLFPKGQTNALKDIFVQTKAEQVCQEHTCTKGHSKGSTSDIRKGITYVRSHIQEGKTAKNLVNMGVNLKLQPYRIMIMRGGLQTKN